MTPPFALNFAGVCAIEFSVNDYIGKEYGNGDSVDTNFHADAMAS